MSRASGLKAVAVGLCATYQLPVTRSNFRAWWLRADFERMDKKTSWRDAFFVAPLSAKGKNPTVPPPLSGITASGNETKLSQGKRVAFTGGGFIGMALGAICLIVGVSLCCTGIGAIIGIPIIIGAFAIFGESGVGIKRGIVGEIPKVLTGYCPYCGYQPISVNADLPGMDCPACKSRIVIRGNVFAKVPAL